MPASIRCISRNCIYCSVVNSIFCQFSNQCWAHSALVYILGKQRWIGNGPSLKEFIVYRWDKRHIEKWVLTFNLLFIHQLSFRILRIVIDKNQLCRPTRGQFFFFRLPQIYCIWCFSVTVKAREKSCLFYFLREGERERWGKGQSERERES